MRFRRPRWLSATAAAFLVPALLVGFATVAFAATVGNLPGDPTKGQALYGSSGCSSCHGSGLGGGIGPPLDKIKDLGDAGGKPLDPDYMIPLITNGKQGVGGYGQMPAKGGANLSDQDIKDLVSFIIQRNSITGPRPLEAGALAKSTITWVTIGIAVMLFLTLLLSRYNMRWIARKAGRKV